MSLLAPNQDNLNLLLDQIANTQIKIPYFLIGPFKKRLNTNNEVLLRLLVATGNEEEIQSSEPVGEDNHVDRMRQIC